MDKSIEKISNRYNVAASEAALWLPLLQRVYFYVLPQKNDWYKPLPGQERLPPLYDCTAMLALDMFVGECISSLVPEDYQFIKIEPGKYYEEDDEVKGQAAEYFAELTDYFFELLAASNFYSVRAEFLEDWAAHGTGSLIFNENDDDDNPFQFHIIPIRLLAVEQGANGSIESLWYKHEGMMIKNIEEHWPKAKLTPRMQKLLDADDTTKIDLIETIAWDYEKKTYRYMVSDTCFQEICMDYYEESSPAIITRYAVTTGELFGRGLGTRALNWIQIINTVYHDELVMGEFALNTPVMAASDSIANLNTLQLLPGAIIPVKPSPDGKSFPVQSWPVNSQFQFTQTQIIDLRMQIEKMFFADMPATPASTQPVTATEIVSRNKKSAQRFGVAHSRFGVEFYRPLVKRALYIMNKRGLIPPVIVNGQEKPIMSDGKIAKTKVASPLATAEGLRRAEALQNYQLLMSAIYQEYTPMLYNIAKLPQEVAQWMNLDPSLVKNEYQMQKTIDDYRAAKEQQAKLEANAKAPTNPTQGKVPT